MRQVVQAVERPAPDAGALVLVGADREHEPVVGLALVEDLLLLASESGSAARMLPRSPLPRASISSSTRHRFSTSDGNTGRCRTSVFQAKIEQPDRDEERAGQRGRARFMSAAAGLIGALLELGARRPVPSSTLGSAAAGAAARSRARSAGPCVARWKAA